MQGRYGYSSSNAYKVNNIDFNYNLEPKLEVKYSKGTNKKNEAVKYRNRMKKIKSIFILVSIFAVAFTIVYRYIILSEMGAQVNSLKSEYEGILAQNQTIQANIDRSVDLNELQAIAHGRLGMVKPERYQIFYVDMSMQDYSENLAKNRALKKDGQVSVEGVPGTLIQAIKDHK